MTETGRKGKGNEKKSLYLRCWMCAGTLQALCTGIVHCPADQRHRDAQQNKEDPVLSQPGHKEPLHPCYAV